MTATVPEEERLLQTSLRNASVVLRERERFERELIATRDALREREERLRATFDQAAVGMAVAALDGRFLEVNRKFEQILGYSAEEIRDRTFLDITHPDDVAATKDKVAELLDGRIPEYSVEKRYLRRDGGIVWSQTSVTVLRDAAGRPERFIGAIEDITHRKATEEALRDESGILDLLNATGMAIASTLDLEPLLQSVTDAATKLTGAEFGAFFFNTTDEDGDAYSLYALSGAPRAAFEQFGDPRATPVFAPTFAGKGAIRLDDVKADPRYGQWAPHHGMPAGHLPVRSYLAVPVVSRSGVVFGGLFFGHARSGMFTPRAERLAAGIAAQAAVAIDNAKLYEDVRRAAREREQLLEAERAARAQAERASMLKDDFLATLSHELRTPLNAILGWSQILLSDKAQEADRRRGLEAIVRNARSQTQLIEDLLDMSRIVSGKLRLDIQVVTLADVIDAAVESVRPAADAKEISVHSVLDPGAGPIQGDPHRLQQVVWNLLANAVKFTPRGGRVGVVLARAGSSVEIAVSDSGVGIDPEFLPHVFDRFRQADGSTTRTHPGLGLGLSIVKNLVELHGGTVRAESDGANQGARFSVRLPVLPVGGNHRSGGAANGEPASSFAIDLSGCRILVVDDEPDAREMIRQLLCGYGAIVTLARGVDDALESVNLRRPHLVVSDIGMPVRDGYHLIRAIRELPASKGGDVPAIALTAFARTEDRTRAMIAGYQVHVSKPIEPSELLAAIASLIQGRCSA